MTSLRAAAARKAMRHAHSSAEFVTLAQSAGQKALKTYRSAASGAVQAPATGSSGGLLVEEASQAASVAHHLRVATVQNHTPPVATGGLYAGPADTKLAPCVVGRLQGMWIDERRGYCRLCAAPMTHGRSFHMGFDRDHISMNGFAFLSIMFPRTWNPQALHQRLFEANSERGRCRRTTDADVKTLLRRGGLEEHGRGLRKVAKFCTPSQPKMMAMDASNRVPVTPDDEQRIVALRALLMHLCTGPTPMRVLRKSLFDESQAGLVGHGEKIFRATVSDLVVALLPPMGPNIQAAFSQKAWGRTNLMLLYDRLGLGEFQAEYQLKPKSNRSDKSAVMRTMIAELSLAHETHGESCPVAAELAELALHRLAFEAVAQKSAHYMFHAQQALAAMGYPSPRDLVESEFW